MADPLFASFFLAGFECSTHRRLDGRRLDLSAATGHDRFMDADYARCHAWGLQTVRDGIRWHLIERQPGRYDFAGVLPALRAAQAGGVEVIWDLFHYGWPDDLDFFAPAFVTRFAALAGAFARLVVEETGRPPLVAPVNEISFVAWGAGTDGFLNPFALGRGAEIKAQLVRAAIAAIEAVWAVTPAARILHPDPLIHVAPDPAKPEDHEAAGHAHRAQYESWDMLAGYRRPELGGHPRYLDIVGVNHYPWNQWIYNGPEIKPGHTLYRPLRSLLAEVYARYRRPLLLSEVGTEGDGRAPWLRYVGREVRAALRAGIPIAGVCLYPVTDYPGWDNERHCPTGLWGYPDATGERPLYQPLARELRRQQALLARMHTAAARKQSLAGRVP
jgi:beta-glucosidase/6-phospho-beta-glucosidase/beta-galactosidase